MALRNPIKLLQTFQALKSMALFMEELREKKSGGGATKLTQEYRLAKQAAKRKYDATVVTRRTYNDKQHLAASRYWTQKKEQERMAGRSSSPRGGGGSRRDPPTLSQKLDYMEKLDDIRTRFPREVLKEKSRQRQIDRDDWDRRRIYKLEERLDKDYRDSLSSPPESIPRATGQTAYDLVGEYNERVIGPAGRIKPMELLPEIYE